MPTYIQQHGRGGGGGQGVRGTVEKVFSGKQPLNPGDGKGLYGALFISSHSHNLN